MKRNAKWFVMTSVLFVALNLVPKISSAQIDPGSDPDAPIDGGVGLLVAAGVGYGLKKVREKRKKQNANLNF
jgi:hypothetical protein